MKNLLRTVVLLLISFSAISLVTAETIEPVDMTPLVVDGVSIDLDGVEPLEMYFIRTRAQEEQLNYILGNVIPIKTYNILGEKLSATEQQLYDVQLANEGLQQALCTTWIVIAGVVVGGVTTGLILGGLQ